MTVNVKAEIENITNALINKIEPKRIYLFGSYARGDETENSDFDICLISDDRSKRRLDLAIMANRAMLGVTKMPVDIVVCYDDDFAERAKYAGTLEKEIASEGVVLYG